MTGLPASAVDLAVPASLAGVLSTIAALGEAAWLVDAARGHVLAANLEAEALFGRGPLEGLDAEDVLPTLEDVAYWDGVRCGAVAVLDSETVLHHPDGRAVPLARRIAPLWLADADPLYLVRARDRSGEQRIAAERETAVAELRATLEATADAILVTDLQGGVRAFNRRFADLWALPEPVRHAADARRVAEWLRMNVLDVDAYDRRLEEIGAQTLAEARDEVVLVDGTVLERHALPQWSQGRPIGRVLSFRPVERRRAASPADAGRAGIDRLTDLPNRAGFLTALDGALRPGRAGAGFAVLVAEFDRDALFGDDAGSGTGLRRLSEFAAQVRGAIRQPHHAARLGGSRFGVLVEHASEAAAEAAARRLIELQAAPGGVPVAIGIAAHPGAGLAAEEILRHAEIAMHRARQDGRSASATHQFGFEAWQRRRDRIEDGLRRALDEGRLRVVAQPRFAVAGGMPVAIDVALRWRDRLLGEVSPMQFHAVAEERGLAGALDDRALELGLAQARRWRAAGLGLRLGVAVSGPSLVEPGFARRVGAALAAAGWPGQELELAVREPALQAEPDAAVAALRALARLGVRVVLDGFGAGPSALASLQRLPLAAVRVDALVAQASAGTGAEARWLPALADLVRSFGLEVQASGVDTDAVQAALQAAGCDAFQGRRLGAWMEAAALEAWLAAEPAQRRLGPGT